MRTLVSRGTAENNPQGKGKMAGASLDLREHSHSEGPEQASTEWKLLQFESETSLTVWRTFRRWGLAEGSLSHTRGGTSEATHNLTVAAASLDLCFWSSTTWTRLLCSPDAVHWQSLTWGSRGGGWNREPKSLPCFRQVFCPRKTKITHTFHCPLHCVNWGAGACRGVRDTAFKYRLDLVLEAGSGEINTT